MTLQKQVLDIGHFATRSLRRGSRWDCLNCSDIRNGEFDSTPIPFVDRFSDSSVTRWNTAAT
jgi:hypothetical protein